MGAFRIVFWILASSAIGLVTACSDDNTDVKWEREVKQRGLEALRVAAASNTITEIGKLFGTRSPTFCVTGTLFDTQVLADNSDPEFKEVYPALQNYVDQRPGDPSSESRRVYAVSATTVNWSAEIYPGVYNLEFSGRNGCYRLTDKVLIENSNPSGPLLITFNSSNSHHLSRQPFAMTAHEKVARPRKSKPTVSDPGGLF